MVWVSGTGLISHFDRKEATRMNETTDTAEAASSEADTSPDVEQDGDFQGDY